MSEAVEATSLAAITAVASNPPLHPNIPCDAPVDPLVLYIARVPGSRDVFLTPLKPREKVVTAEDVQSSLYYVHINCDDDYDASASLKPPLLDTNGPQLATVPESLVRRKPMLPAKPVKPVSPVSPPYPVDRPAQQYVQRLPDSRRPLQVARKPVIRDVTNDRPPPPPAHHGLPEIPKRPLPTPPEEQPYPKSLHAENIHLLRHSDHSPENNPYFRQYNNDAATESHEHVPSAEAGSLTLIRRDPSSNQQWNVASIHDPPMHEVSSSNLLNPSSAKCTKRGGAPLYLDMTNPGYLQFVDTDRPESRTSTSTDSSDNEPAPEGTFRRRLYMPGSRYGEHGYGHRRLKSDDSRASTDMPRTMRDRSTPNGDSPRVDLRSRGYTFTSPWEGRCDFSTGATGKSLKCRHSLSQHGTAEVSELRFNLPTSSRIKESTIGEKRSSYFSRHSRLLSSEDGSQSPTFVIDDDGRVDLTLGQERAGGGFGGKQAKLGKLIIGREGLKMLDLLVAANIGLWWRAYERA